ncbi:CTD small phosphatase-like protein 2-B isoform X4 [Macadamia integrifolia]|uniref:CTD small phosphatase-like protein 2-B isoform X4 n=1 Tax=Macadamia integrifolia TaxID=60698 RepID=UPI001C52C2A7|nr:CTD small phosphatase-like protein 2-B isoform X4 [Macadamia integrifolia]
MPALKMKAKSNPEGLRGQSLQVSNKSCKISKSSSQQVRISQQTAELDTDLQNSQDVYSNFEASLQGMGCDEVVDDPKLVNGATLQLQESSLSSVDSAAVSRMQDFPSASCNQDLETIFSPVLESSSFPSNLETIFSPILETNEVHYIPEIYNYAGFDDVAEANSFLGYNCTDSDMTSDMTERYMILPFLEETARPSNVPDEELCEEVVMNSDDSCLYLAIHKMKSSGQEPDVNSNSVDSDEGDCFEPHLFIKNFPDLSDVVPSFRPMLLPKETRKRKSITLVLDLDETLVHSTLEQCDDADFTFQVFFNMEEHTVYVRQRPYLQTFLERVAEMFEVFVFTASQSNYAEQLLNILDPEGKLISRRAYRESCIFSDGSYTKDLTVLGVDLAKVAIIDNSPQVFRLQVNNGIPIKSWFDDPSDRALISLLPFLETLVDADDVRPIIAKRFGDSDLAKIITLAFTLHR